MDEQNTNQAASAALSRQHRLTHYCAAGAGVAVLVGTVATADASITYINFNTQVFTDPTPRNGS